MPKTNIKQLINEKATIYFRNFILALGTTWKAQNQKRQNLHSDLIL